MKYVIPSFDPTAKINGSVNLVAPDGYGTLIIANESSVSLIVTINQDQQRVSPWEKQKIVLTEASYQLQWRQEFILTNSAASPVALVLIDQYSSDVIVPDTYPVALVRAANVGGTVNTVGTTTLANDGGADGIVVMEATPLSQASSAFSFDNSGNYTLRSKVASVWSVIFGIVSNGANVFHGTSDNVPATGVTAGALPVGVTIPGSQVSSIVASATTATSANALNNALVGGDNAANHYAVLRTNQNASAARDLLVEGWDGTTARVHLQCGQSAGGIAPLAQIDNSGNFSSTSYNGNGGGVLKGISAFTGAASGSYTHGLAVTPLSVQALQKVAGSTNTYGSDTYGTATVHINVNASPQAFTAIAMA